MSPIKKFGKMSKLSGQPTGIIKCLPPAWVQKSGGLQYVKSIRKTIDSGEHQWFMSFPTKPRREVLHLYVLFDGHVQFRVNIAVWRGGNGLMNMYGGQFLAKWWAVCTGPMTFPPKPVPMRGFRGYRYTEELW